MRNHVVLKAALAAATSKLVRVGVIAALVPAALAALAGSAQAGTRVTAAGEDTEAASNTLAFDPGTVGIAAVVIGLFGLVIGLLRHRRREASAVAAVETTRPMRAQGAERPAGERAA